MQKMIQKSFEDRLDSLLAEDVDPKYKKSLTRRKRMLEHREKIFPFFYDPDLPFDNNGSERAHGNLKFMTRFLVVLDHNVVLKDIYACYQKSKLVKNKV